MAALQQGPRPGVIGSLYSLQFLIHSTFEPVVIQYMRYFEFIYVFTH